MRNPLIISIPVVTALLTVTGCAVADMEQDTMAEAPYTLNLSGHVYNSRTMQPVQGMTVSLESYPGNDSGFTTVIGRTSSSSGEDGSFSLSYRETEQNTVYLVKAVGSPEDDVRYAPYSAKLILYESSPSYDYSKNLFSIENFDIALTPAPEK